MIISISGPPGSGKSFAAEVLARKLHIKHYSIGTMRGEMALKRGMTINEFNKIGEKKDFTDRELDEYQKKLGRKKDNFVIDGRLSWHFIPQSVKIYLDVSLKEGAKRRFEHPRKDEQRYKSIKEVILANKERIASDRKRYKKYYHVDCFDKRNYDLVLDTTNNTTNQTVKKILSFLNNKSQSYKL